MMDASDIQAMIEGLSGNIDDLEEALAPLLKSALSASTSKLPLLDKAKLYVLATYAIESVLFSLLRINGVDAKAHPVFQELNRVKEYFAKIKSAETVGTKRSATVDKEAAGRFVRHGLAGNDKYDRERKERMESERAGAKRKLNDMQIGTHTRFDGVAKRMRASEGQEASSTADEDGDLGRHNNGLAPAQQSKRERKAERQQRKLALTENGPAESEGPGSADTPDDSDTVGVARSKHSTAPRGHSETFQALLRGPLPKRDEKSNKKKKKKSKASGGGE